ncbi:ankyrin repeat protein [Afipia massiliensis]|uniref:Ankyrin repeat protein n=1 Tax=Afipia massiliensis TaxID=211460 RepID=A0A840N2D3_9BRAD|nr:ankyrin repeat domain-containing protein [Afipia massiliensis]MBB5052697.1 ankyrin repeat protein [Afipia massiliensis]
MSRPGTSKKPSQNKPGFLKRAFANHAVAAAMLLSVAGLGYTIETLPNREAGNAVLLWAAAHGQTQLVKLLLNRGADIHAMDDKALRLAALKGHTDTVRLLLDRGAEIHAVDDGALRWAAGGNRYTETVRLLLDQGADVHAQNEAALQWAASNGHAETVRLLQDRGGDVHKALRSAMASANQPTATALREAIQNQSEATQNQSPPSSPKLPAPLKL